SRPRPRIALTMGDVAGIGPEVIARALSSERVRTVCRPVVIGDEAVFSRAMQLAGCTTRIESRSSLAEAVAVDEVAAVGLWNPIAANMESVRAGAVSGIAGRAAHDWLVAAIDAALEDQIDAIATAPLSKAALH